MKIGRLEVKMFADSGVARIIKHENDHVQTEIRLDGDDDIYALEFAVAEIKRKLGLK